MQKHKRIICTIILIILILTSFGNNGVLAALSPEAAGSAIVSAATNYMYTYGAETRYDASSDYRRAQTVFYQQKTDGPDGYYYYLECASFVLLALRNGINIQSEYPQYYDDATGAYTGFEPKKTGDKNRIDIPPFGKVSKGISDISQLKPGDIIMNTHHVMIYTGSNKIIHCDGKGAGNGIGHISWETIDEYATRWGEDKGTYDVYRLGHEATDNLDESDLQRPPTGAIQAIGQWIYEQVPFKQVHESSVKKDQTFPYEGISKTESQTATNNNTSNNDSNNTTDNKTTNDEEWRFPNISDLLKWILSSMYKVIKGIIVGMTTIVQVLITNWVDSASGEDVSSRLSNGMMAYLESGLREDIKDSLTMEKIVYNQVPILDVDIFNGNQAGGKTVSDGSLIMIIRNLVATLYLAIRKIAIIGLLVSLIYFGIQIAIASTGEQKADYKKKLVSWGIAFFIVFGMHYFLIGVMKVNEITVGLLKDVGSSIASSVSGGAYTDLAMAMRDLTYQDNMSKSAVAVVMYIVMVYYLILFLIIYFKRLFITMVLIILGPLIGIKYALDKIRFNKSSSLATWGKEYIFSVGTQTIHALIYTIFIGITYKLMTGTSNSQIIVCLVACLFFKFMTTAEKMLRDMLRLAGQQSESIMGDIDNTDIKELFGYALIARMSTFNKFKKKEYVPNYVFRKYEQGKTFFHDHLRDEYVKSRKNELVQKHREAYLTNAQGQEAKISSNLDQKIDNILKQEFEYKLHKSLGSIHSGTNLGIGMLRIPAGIALTAGGNGKGDTFIGISRMYMGTKTVAKAIGEPIIGYKSQDEIIKLRAKDGTYQKLQDWIRINGTIYGIEQLKEGYLYPKDEVIAKNNKKLSTLHEARKLETDIEQEVADKKETVLKGAEPGATDFEKSLADKRTEELKQNVREAMKTVDRKDIQEEVKKYMKESGKYSLTLDDFKNIAERFDVKVSGEIMDEKTKEKVNKEIVVEHIKKDTIAKFIREVTENDELSKEAIIDTEALEHVEDNVKAKMKKAKGKDKEGLKLTLKCLEDKKKELQGEEVTKTYSNLSDAEQQLVQKELKAAIDEIVVEKQVQKLTRDQIIDTMKKAVDKKGSIKRDVVTREFKPLIEKIEKIRQLDEIARENGQGKIYDDVGTLVEKMVKNPKITNRP